MISDLRSIGLIQVENTDWRLYLSMTIYLYLNELMELNTVSISSQWEGILH